MLNNLTILFVGITLFVYLGGKNVPKKLSKYKLLIVGLTCGLIACQFVNNVENFDVTYGDDSIYSCNGDQRDKGAGDYCSMKNCHGAVRGWVKDRNYSDPKSIIRDLQAQCKTTYIAGETHSFTGSSVREIHDSGSRLKNEEWCSNPNNINTGGPCYNCGTFGHVTKGDECLRCSISNRWSTTTCPR